MVIKKAVLEMIADISSGMGYELGGLLGSSFKGIITDVAADTPTDKVGCRFEYRPNTALLNKQIEKWAEEGIAFAGLFHTHFSGSRTLSDADKVYIKKIMEGARGIADCLYFPVYTLPDKVLNVYKAYFDDEKTVIGEDALSII